MVISSDKVKIARDKLSKFLSDNRKDTNLKVKWSIDTEKELKEAFEGKSAAELLKDSMTKDLEKYSEPFKEAEDKFYYCWPIYKKGNNENKEIDITLLSEEERH